MSSDEKTARVAFQGELGAFSEAAAIQLLGKKIVTVPRPTFDALFRAIEEGEAHALLAPVENSLAGSVVRVYDLLLESELGIVAETILRIEHHLIGCPGATLDGLKSVASHPVALAQCEKFFLKHPGLKRVTVEDTAGSVRDVVAVGDKTAAGIAGRQAALRYGGVILQESIQDNSENFTRFALLVPFEEHPHSHPIGTLPTMSPALAEMLGELGVNRECHDQSPAIKLSLAMRLAHQPGALLAALEPFAKYGINLLKIESRPIHGRPWEYQFFLDLQTEKVEPLEQALEAVQKATSFLRVLGMYPPAQKA